MLRHKLLQKSKQIIPKAIRQRVWLDNIGAHFSGKCSIKWCKNKITVFNYHVGHNIPEKRGGTIDISNLKPLCSNCNLSMGCTYSIDEWNKIITVNKCCSLM